MKREDMDLQERSAHDGAISNIKLNTWTSLCRAQQYLEYLIERERKRKDAARKPIGEA